jgi:hypothetical protein
MNDKIVKIANPLKSQSSKIRETSNSQPGSCWPILLLALTFTTEVFAQTGFINGSFEIPTLGSNTSTLWLPQGSTLLAGWTIGGTGGPVLLADSWPGGYAAYQGSQWLVFNAGNTARGSTISQTFQTVIGQNYEVSFAAGSDGFGDVSLTASASASDGTVLATTNCVPPPGWEMSELNFVATTTNSTLTFLDTSPSTGGADSTLDDITVTATNAPPPPTNPPPPVIGGFVNGGFEMPPLGSNTSTLWLPQGSTLLTGWTIGGTGGPVLLAESWPGGYSAYQGSQWLVFNAGNTAPGSTISQTFQTVIGQNYEVSFAAGSDGFGDVSLEASASASDGTVLATNNCVPPAGWEMFALNFVATTTNSTLTFLDTSPFTDGADSTLDDITVTATNASPPPPPPTNPPPPVIGGFVNGGFEMPPLGSNTSTLWLPQGSTLLTGWSIGGTGGPVLLADSWPGGYAAYQGSQWLVFNAGDTAPGSTISQTFQTIVGQNYEVSFAAGSDGLGDVSLEALASASDGTVLATNNCVPPAGWEMFALNFVATTTNSTLTFLDTSPFTDGADSTLDDIVVTATNAPPPPTNPPPVAVGAFANGSFEIPALGSNTSTLWLPQGSTLLTGWTIGGTGGPVLLADSWPGGYSAYQGSQWLVFNAGNTAPGSTISQTFQTIVGQNYEVSFAVGADGFGDVSLEALASASDGTVLATTNCVPPPGWEMFELNYVATTTNSTLTFVDTSPSTGGADSTLDDITVTATNAPPPPPPPSTNPPPPAISGFINGGFEIPALGTNTTTLWLAQGSTLLTGWTIGGTGGPVLLADSWPGGYSAYQGRQWLVFNAGNTAPGSTISQTFQTIVGQGYEVSFAVGSDGVGNVSLAASALAADGTVLATGNCAPPNESWELFELNFVATTTNSTLTFLDTSAFTDGADATLDDVAVGVTSAPPTNAPALVSVRIVDLTVLPSLNINQSGTNVVLSWPAGAEEFTIEFAPDLGGNWSVVSAPRQTNGSTITLTAPVISNGGFFRLNLH